MQRNFLGFVLLGLALTSALVTAVLSLQTYNVMVESKRATARVVEMQKSMAIADRLLNDALDYSKKNPAILQAIRSAGITNLPIPAATSPRR